MKRISLDEAKRNLKRILKNKISINEKTVITYLMMGMIGLFSSTAVMAAAVTQGTGAQAHETGVALGASFTAWNGPQNGAQANGEGAIAIGGASVANTGKQSIAIGQSSKTTATQAIAIGGDVLASGVASISLGGDDAEGTPYANLKYNSTTGKVETAGTIQYQSTTASGAGSVSIGVKSQAKGQGSVSLGVLSSSEGTESIALGAKSAAKGANSSAIGAGAVASGANSVAAGYEATASKADSVALGKGASSLGNSSTALGTLAQAKADRATAIGKEAVAENLLTVALGANSLAKGDYSFAAGVAAKTTTMNSIAIGTDAEMDGKGTGGGIAIGKNARALGKGAMAVGTSAKAEAGEFAMAVGDTARAFATNSLAVGVGAEAGEKTGDVQLTLVGGKDGQTVSSPVGNSSVGVRASAFGRDAKAQKNDSTALGALTTASEIGAVALGANSKATTASGVKGYDIVTEAASTTEDRTWKSTTGAVSVGSTTVSRQITNVAAGSADTDAVNVAQLKKAKVEIVGTNGITATKDPNTTTHTKYTVSLDPALKNKLDAVPNNIGDVVTNVTNMNNKLGNTDLPNTKIEGSDNTAAPTTITGAVKDLATAVNKGLNFTANEGAAINKKLGETLKIKGSYAGTDPVSSKNIKTVNNGNEIEIVMTENPEFKGVTIDDGNSTNGKTVINNDGIQIQKQDGTTAAKLTRTGLDNGGNKIVNVAKGDVSDNSTDAINGAQLMELKKTLGLAIDPVTGQLTPLAKELRNKNGEAITNNNLGDTVLSTVDVVNSGLVYGADSDEYVTLAQGNDRDARKQQLGSTLTVKAATTALTKGTETTEYVGKNVTTKYVRGADGNGNISIGISDKPTFSEVTAQDPNNADKSTKLIPGGVEIKDGNNTTVIGRDSNGNLTVDKDGTNTGEAPKALATKDEVDAVKGSADKIAEKLGLPKDGQGNFTDLGIPKVDGSNSTAAPTTLVGAVNDAVTAINKGITLVGNDFAAADNTTSITKKLGEKFEIVGEHAGTEVSAKNIKTDVENGKLLIKMAEKPEFKEITVKDPANNTDGSGTVIGKDGVTVKNATGGNAISLTNTNGSPTLSFADNKGTINGLADRTGVELSIPNLSAKALTAPSVAALFALSPVP